jgi:hypothetical protein
MDHSKNPSTTTSAADLITELIDIGHAERSLLPPEGSEQQGHVRSIGSALDYTGGIMLILQIHDAVHNKIGRVYARKLEAA